MDPPRDNPILRFTAFWWALGTFFAIAVVIAAIYIFDRLEYDSGTLNEEYQRDLASVQVEGAEIAMPVNYFPSDDPSLTPQNRWRSHGHLLYGNWISEIYETTPYDISKIGLESTDLRG